MGQLTTRATSATSPPLRVVAADDSYLIREAITAVLASSERVELVAMAADGTALWEAIEREDPDVAIVDIRMPPSGDLEGVNIANRLRQERPSVGLVALSQWAEPSLAVGLLRPSAHGRAYLLKQRLHDRNELVNAIAVVAQGGSVIDPIVVQELIEGARKRPRSPVDELTPREREVLSLMARGMSNRAIADELILTKRAVEKHIGSIFQKLELEDEEIVSRRVAAVLLFLADSSGMPALAQEVRRASD
jgi:DNA-binding NarL/FixJ family response regulator